MNKKYDKYFFSTKEYNQAILDLEDFIFENEQDFLRIFCHSADNLIKFSLSSDKVDCTYILPSGQHICDSLSLCTVMEWVKELEDNA